MNRLSLITHGFLMLMIISGCASSPEFDLSQVNKKLTPEQIQSAPQAIGSSILWGGTIIETRNQSDSTLIEVLAYPLNRFNRPQTDQQTLGRFLIKHKGYLEATHYAPGRSVSVVGSISKLQSGKIGNSTYQYPLVISKQIHLWKKQQSSSSGSFHFGIGISL